MNKIDFINRSLIIYGKTSINKIITLNLSFVMFDIKHNKTY